MEYVVSNCGIGFRLKEASEKLTHPYEVWLQADIKNCGLEIFEKLCK